VFTFSGTEGESVFLGDNTGEAAGLEVRLAYDAVRFTFVGGAAGSSSGDETGSQDGTDSASTDDAASAGDDATASATATADDGGTDDSGDGGLPTTYGAADDDSGCGCRSITAPSTGLAILLVPLVRRLRRRA
jgi:hypothetical protein